MASFFDLCMYAKASAIEHPFLALIAVLVSTIFLLPPLAFAAFLGSPILVPVALLLLVRHTLATVIYLLSTRSTRICMQFRKVYTRPAKQEAIQEQGSQGEDTTAGVLSVCYVHVLHVLTHQQAITLFDSSAAANCFSLGTRIGHLQLQRILKVMVRQHLPANGRIHSRSQLPLVSFNSLCRSASYSLMVPWAHQSKSTGDQHQFCSRQVSCFCPFLALAPC